jgi:hypothetical protein
MRSSRGRAAGSRDGLSSEGAAGAAAAATQQRERHGCAAACVRVRAQGERTPRRGLAAVKHKQVQCCSTGKAAGADYEAAQGSMLLGGSVGGPQGVSRVG